MTTFLDPNDARLTAYAFGELDESDRSDVERLLADSPELQAELTEIMQVAELLRQDLAREPMPTLTMAQRDKLAEPCEPVQPAASSAPLWSDHFRFFVADSRRRRATHQWALAAVIAVTALVVMAISLPAPDPGVERIGPVRRARSMFTERSSPESICDIDLSEPISGSRSSEDGIDPQSPSIVLKWHSEFGPGEPLNLYNHPQPGTIAGPIAHDLSPGVSVTGSSQLSPGNSPTFGWSDQSLKWGDQSGVASGPARVMKSQFQNKEPSTGGGMMQISNGRPGSSPRVVSDPVPVASPSARFNQPSIAGGGVPLQTFGGVGLPGDVRLLKEGESREAEVNAPATSLALRKNSNPEPKAAFYFETLTEGVSHENYEAPPENPFLTPSQQPLSTFSIDVDSASYSNIRRFFAQGQLPPPGAVRIEEMINYFTYSYPQPKAGEPFSVTADAAPCPWKREHYLARIALQARAIDKAKRPPTNLVFLLDVSGSMQPPNKLPLVKQAMTMLVEELNERDRIAIVTYAGDAGIKLTSTVGNDQIRIMQAIDALQAGGSTNGAAGINLAYEEALKHFNDEGENRVILCTDGDFNVGVSSDDQLVELIQQQAKSKVFLSIFGFGMGNLKDAKLEKLADKGNGHYGYIDDLREARRVFHEELVGTLYTVAKDVKIQVEFNPLTVGAYRLIGYENRTLAARDFNDDTKDAGEIGAGHTVTALYEIVPKGQWPKTQAIDPLKYASARPDQEPVAPANQPKPAVPADVADDLFTVKLRYKQPTADTSVKTIDYVVDDIAGKNVVPSTDLLWAASVASFGMHLKQSQFKGQWALNDIYETAQGAKGTDANGRRREFLDLILAAKRLSPANLAQPESR